VQADDVGALRRAVKSSGVLLEETARTFIPKPSPGARPVADATRVR